MAINYNERIPNNVDLAENRRLQRALEAWQPNYMRWWHDLGPEGSGNFEVYLRTAISVESDGWANFGYVRMPDYRWGIFLTHPVAGRTIAFGDHKGDPAWQEVPGEYRGPLRRLIVTQGDTEPASVEQQRQLGLTCPSLYDLRNLFQVNVEEGRHLWAMVYLLHAHFGRDGRDEAEAMLERHSGDPDKPRILGAFNEPTPDWLSFYMFTYFTDRDGKYQLASLAESGFDPLARTCQFMLTEEAHHMFVGESGVMRIAQRTCEVMNELKTDDPAKIRAAGAIDLDTLQRYINFHYSVSLDLFGQELSTNAANYYTTGLKGRYHETKIEDDHKLVDAVFPVPMLKGEQIVIEDQPALTAINERLREDYIADCERGLKRWNKVIKAAGIAREFALPHRAFNRRIGLFANVAPDIRVSPDGRVITEAEWTHRVGSWLPTSDDHAFVGSLMRGVVEPGRIAGWIAPPARGINGQPFEFEYVKFH
jgi:benzoyl-CoA 2,3-dioxygenase component B